METVATGKALGRKSGCKGDGKMASGSGKNKKVPIPKAERENLAAGAMTRREGRTGVLKRRERMEAEDDASMGKMEVEKEVLPSLETPKVFAKVGVEKKKIGNSSATQVHAILRGDLDIMCKDGDSWAAWAEWEAKFAEIEEITKTTTQVKRMESIEEWEMRREEEDKEFMKIYGSDHEAWRATQFRRDWNYVWSGKRGSFEDTTRVPAMRFTDKPAPDYRARTQETLQIFSAKVSATRGGLQWPLDVFGMVAIRDNIDHNRNIIFNRRRENCQALTKEDPNLVLVGPTRAVVLLSPHPVTIEVDLKVKGTAESEDKDLSFLAVPIIAGGGAFCSCLLNNNAYTSKLSTLEFTLGCIASSVEATIFVRVIRGSWPDGFRGEFAASTPAVCGRTFACDQNATRLGQEKIVLLDSSGEKVHVTGDGEIKLSRRVVSVEFRGELKVSVKAGKVDKDVVEKKIAFAPLKAGYSRGKLDIGFCEMEVKVAWSLISHEPFTATSVL